MTEAIAAEIVAGLTAAFCAYVMYKGKKREDRLDKKLDDLEDRLAEAISKVEMKEYVTLVVNPLERELGDTKKSIDKLSKKIDENYKDMNSKLDLLLLKDK